MKQGAIDMRIHAPDPAVDAVLPDILYIMGTGRSGTTILEILLASNRGFTGVGEVKHIFRDGYLMDMPCACGSSARQCELWSAVLRSTGWKHEELGKLRETVERIESHARFPFTFSKLIARENTALYGRAAEALFTSVAAARGSSVVVDSSKYAGRALMLSRLFPNSVKVLCITRSAEGILDAFQKKNDAEQRPKGPLAVAAYYMYVLLCMKLVRRQLKDRCFSIRFEDLNRNPEAVLGAIETWSGYSLSTARARVARNEFFEVGHIVTGNRIRKKRKVRFEPGSSRRVEPVRSVARKILESGLERYRNLLGF